MVRAQRSQVQLISPTIRTRHHSLVTHRILEIRTVRTIDGKAAVIARRAMVVQVGERDIGIQVGGNMALRDLDLSHPWALADLFTVKVVFFEG